MKSKSKRSTFLYILASVMIVVTISSLVTPCSGETLSPHHKGGTQEIQHYTCGMHASVKVSPEEYNKGTKNCPICNMNLTPAQKDEKGAGSHIMGGKHE